MSFTNDPKIQISPQNFWWGLYTVSHSKELPWTTIPQPCYICWPQHLNTWSSHEGERVYSTGHKWGTEYSKNLALSPTKKIPVTSFSCLFCLDQYSHPSQPSHPPILLYKGQTSRKETKRTLCACLPLLLNDPKWRHYHYVDDLHLHRWGSWSAARLSNLPSWWHSHRAKLGTVPVLTSFRAQALATPSHGTWGPGSPSPLTVLTPLARGFYSTISSLLPWRALLMRTSSLPWSHTSLLWSGKHIPAGLNHPHGLLAQSSHSGPRNNL